jgi:hypothetical protein
VATRGEKQRAQPGVVVTRIHRWHGPPAVVRVQTRTDVIVAVPDRLPDHHVLDLASLVLTHREYEELRSAIEPTPDTGPRPPPFAAKPSR